MEHNYRDLLPFNLIPIYSNRASQTLKTKVVVPHIHIVHSQGVNSLPFVGNPYSGCPFCGAFALNPLDGQLVVYSHMACCAVRVEQQLEWYKLELQNLELAKTPKAYKRTTRRGLEKKLVDLERRLNDL